MIFLRKKARIVDIFQKVSIFATLNLEKFSLNSRKRNKVIDHEKNISTVGKKEKKQTRFP